MFFSARESTRENEVSEWGGVEREKHAIKRWSNSNDNDYYDDGSGGGGGSYNRQKL